MSRRNLEVALTVLSIGFGLDGFASLYALVHPRGSIFAGGAFLALPLILGLVGFLFARIGRNEWGLADAKRARDAALIFGASLLGVAVGLGTPLLLTLAGLPGAAQWAPAAVGVAGAVLVIGFVASYVFLLLDLVPAPGRVVLGVALTWASGVAVMVGLLLARNVGPLVSLISQPGLQIPPPLAQVDHVLSFLCVTFLLLFAVSVGALVAVARGRIAVPSSRGAAIARTG